MEWWSDGVMVEWWRDGVVVEWWWRGGAGVTVEVVDRWWNAGGVEWWPTDGQRDLPGCPRPAQRPLQL